MSLKRCLSANFSAHLRCSARSPPEAGSRRQQTITNRSSYRAKRSSKSKAAILTIGEIKCHGKFIYLRIRGANPVQDQWRVFHTLGMGGGWSVSRKPKKNLCLELVLQSATTEKIFSIYYYDSRRFGTFKFLEGDEGIYALQSKLTKKLGPDLLTQEKPISFLDFQDRLKARKGTWTIAQALMNQSVVTIMRFK